MPYSTQAQLVFAAGGTERFLALTDWDGDGTADADAIAWAQAAADSWIDSFIPQRYATPLTAPTVDIQRIAAEEAIYALRADRTMVSERDASVHEARERYMKDVRAGRVRPMVETNDAVGVVKPTIIRLGGRARDWLRGWSSR